MQLAQSIRGEPSVQFHEARMVVLFRSEAQLFESSLFAEQRPKLSHLHRRPMARLCSAWSAEQQEWFLSPSTLDPDTKQRQHAFDTTGQVASPGMEPRVTMSWLGNEASYYFQVVTGSPCCKTSRYQYDQWDQTFRCCRYNAPSPT